MPAFDNAMRTILLELCEFDWGEVSPAIFGGLFESVIDKVTQRKQGAHYTPEDAILRLTGPLFLDELQAELVRAKSLKSAKDEALGRFTSAVEPDLSRPGLRRGNFSSSPTANCASWSARSSRSGTFAPALRGGGGRPAEAVAAQCRPVLRDRDRRISGAYCGGRAVDDRSYCQHAARRRFRCELCAHPLVAAPNIRNADALEFDWNDLLAAERCSLVIGNPPFGGRSYQSDQREQMRAYGFGRHGNRSAHSIT